MTETMLDELDEDSRSLERLAEIGVASKTFKSLKSIV
jgi:hypothetical protein